MWSVFYVDILPCVRGTERCKSKLRVISQLPVLVKLMSDESSKYSLNGCSKKVSHLLH